MGFETCEQGVKAVVTKTLSMIKCKILIRLQLRTFLCEMRTLYFTQKGEK